MQYPHTACRLEIKHLRLVQAIASEGTVTRAAGRLHLSQSAVSHQLVDLERDLGTRLFDRVGKRMSLTTAGARVLASAERLLSELASLERDLADDGRRARIPLRMTASCYTSYEWLPPALVGFAKTHPRIDITIVLEATRRGMEALIADEVDLAIVAQPPKDPTWTCAPLVTSELVAVASPKHVAMTRGALESGVVKWRDLRNTTVLVHDIPEDLLAMLENAVRNSWHAKSGERLVHPIEVRKIPLTEALIELARANSGVVIVDDFILNRYLPRRERSGGRVGGDLVSFSFAPPAQRSFHLVWRKQNPRGLPLSQVAETIQRAGRSAIAPPRAKKTSAKQRAVAASS